MRYLAFCLVILLGCSEELYFESEESEETQEDQIEEVQLPEEKQKSPGGCALYHGPVPVECSSFYLETGRPPEEKPEQSVELYILPAEENVQTEKM